MLSETILGPCWRSWGLSWNFEGPSWYLGGDFGCSWRPSWSHVGDLGGYLGHLRAYAGRSWLGKPTKWTSYRYLRGFVAKKFCDWQSSWGHLGASLSLLGPSWRPSWAMLEILGAILGIFELMLDEVGLGNRPSGLRIGICEVFAKKFCGGAGMVLASAGKCWEVRRNGASLCDFVRSLQISSLRFSTPCSPSGAADLTVARIPPGLAL